MTITSIGSSFSYIRPERAGGAAASAAAEAQESATRPDTDRDSDGSSSSTKASTAGPTKPTTVWAASDELKAAMLRVQEERKSTAPSAAVRAYAGR